MLDGVVDVGQDCPDRVLVGDVEREKLDHVEVFDLVFHWCQFPVALSKSPKRHTSWTRAPFKAWNLGFVVLLADSRKSSGSGSKNLRQTVRTRSCSDASGTD